MQLLGPLNAQVDTIETCLYALTKLMESLTKLGRAAPSLFIEDVLDFILMDQERIVSASNEAIEAGKTQVTEHMKMHHKFAVKPSGLGELNAAVDGKCKYCTQGKRLHEE